MKLITFTIEEKALLKGLLEIRLEFVKRFFYESGSVSKEEDKRHWNFYLKPLIMSLEKISMDNVAYTDKEKSCFISCSNEHIDAFYKKFTLSDTISWLRIHDEQLKVISTIDMCKDILKKCGYYSKRELNISHNPEFRYRDVLLKIEMLKHSDLILLSKTDRNEIYKLAFVHDKKEYFQFALDQPASLQYKQFIPMNGSSPESFANGQFGILTTKAHAKELLTMSDHKYYPEGVLECMNLLLS